MPRIPFGKYLGGMSNLISRSTSHTVAENSLATAIAFPESSDTDFASSALLVAVTALPSDGMVVLADGITPVTLGETLTVAQLIGLKFRPTLDSFGTTSTFAFSVSDPAGNPAASTSVEMTAPDHTSFGSSALTVKGDGASVQWDDSAGRRCHAAALG
jgi:hypothetical protein